MSENLFQTEDKYSAVSFGFAPNRWHVTNDEKSCVLSVNDEYNYSKLFELFNTIEVDKREAIAWAVIGKKEFVLSDGELAQIKQDTADTLSCLRAVTQKINSAFDFLPIGDSRAYISPMNTASVFFSPGEGILNFLYADFDSAYNECLNRTKKDLPDETSLDISLLTEKEKDFIVFNGNILIPKKKEILFYNIPHLDNVSKLVLNDNILSINIVNPRTMIVVEVTYIEQLEVNTWKRLYNQINLQPNKTLNNFRPIGAGKKLFFYSKSDNIIYNAFPDKI